MAHPVLAGTFGGRGSAVREKAVFAGLNGADSGYHSRSMRPLAVVPLALLAVSCSGSAQKAPAETPSSSASAAATSEARPATPAPTVGTQTEVAVHRALAGSHRSEKNRARDRYRHPAETLLFFGLEPDMTVIELWPGRGWYTEVLAPVLREKGKLIVATMDPEDQTFRGRFAREFRDTRQAQREIYEGVQAVVLFPPDNFTLGPAASADLVLSFRSAHNWIRWGGYEGRVFDAVARVLKPGATFGIVQHRAHAGDVPQESAENGYVPEAYLIDLAEEAGLEFVAVSEVNANPDDVKSYPNGVWSLPPTLRGGEVDRKDFIAVGESDRATLLFRRPQ